MKTMMQIALRIAFLEMKNLVLSFASVILGTVAFAVLYRVSDIKFTLKYTYISFLKAGICFFDKLPNTFIVFNM